MKEFPIRSISEEFRIQFKSEFFNLFNRPNFATPGEDGTGGSIGSQLFTDPRSGNPNPNAAQILRTVTTSRQIQFSLKVIF
jgi:hypothetical protein